MRCGSGVLGASDPARERASQYARLCAVCTLASMDAHNMVVTVVHTVCERPFHRVPVDRRAVLRVVHRDRLVKVEKQVVPSRVPTRP